jgi:hypothetical protein
VDVSWSHIPIGAEDNEVVGLNIDRVLFSRVGVIAVGADLSFFTRRENTWKGKLKPWHCSWDLSTILWDVSVDLSSKKPESPMLAALITSLTLSSINTQQVLEPVSLVCFAASTSTSFGLLDFPASIRAVSVSMLADWRDVEGTDLLFAESLRIF